MLQQRIITGRYLGIDDLHFHGLRHEATSRLFEADLPIEKVALVTWNIEQLHSEDNPARFRRVVRLIRDIRCALWAVQEVWLEAMQRLIYELNNISSI